MSTHVVMRRLPGPSGDLPAGTEVDASTWKNKEALVSMGYIKPVEKPKKETYGKPKAN